MRQVFTTEEKMGRWEDLREIKNLMGRLSTDYVLKRQREMFRTYWSTREDVCLGINEGWFTGRTHVARYYDVQASASRWRAGSSNRHSPRSWAARRRRRSTASA